MTAEDLTLCSLPNLSIGGIIDGMRTMNIFLPDALRAFVDEQVTQRGYGTSSEYVCELIRKELERAHLRNLLLDGANSGPAVRVDEAFFKRLRRRLKEKTS